MNSSLYDSAFEAFPCQLKPLCCYRRATCLDGSPDWPRKQILFLCCWLVFRARYSYMWIFNVEGVGVLCCSEDYSCFFFSEQSTGGVEADGRAAAEFKFCSRRLERSRSTLGHIHLLHPDTYLTLTLAVMLSGVYPAAWVYSLFSCCACVPTRLLKLVVRWRLRSVFCGGMFSSMASVSKLNRGSSIYEKRRLF